MIKNSLMKFIDSCVGNIARKIEDEFRESDHPRDKGGKFTSKGNEGRGGGKKDKSSSGKPMNISVSAGGDTEGLEAEAEKYGVKAELGESSHGETSVKLSGSKEDIRRYLEEKFYGSEEEAREFSPEAYEESEESSSSKPAKKVDAKASRHIHQVLEDEIRQIAENSDDKDEFKINLGAFLEDYVTDDMADTDERAMDNFGYDKETVHAVAEEMKGEIDSIADDIFEEDDDTSVTGPEDRDYMNEEEDDDDEGVSLNQYKENVRENFDGDAHSAVELGSPEHKNIRQDYMSALTGSVPSLDSTARVKWALDQVDNVMRRFGTESAKNRLMGIVYNVVGLKNSGDKGLVYKQLSDYIKEFE